MGAPNEQAAADGPPPGEVAGGLAPAVSKLALVETKLERNLRWIAVGLRWLAVIAVASVIWVLGRQQTLVKEKIVAPIKYIGHSDEAAYATGGVSLAEGRGLTVPYVSYFFTAYSPDITRREDHWPPFMSFAIAPCVWEWGKSAAVCKLPGIFFGSIGVPLATALLTYALSRRGYAAMVAGLIMMAHPLIYDESLKTLSDVALAMLVAAFAGSVVLAQRQPWMYLAAGFFLACAYFAKGSQLVLFPLYPVMAVMCAGPAVIFRKRFWAGLGVALLFVGPYWYGNWKSYGAPLHSTQNYVSGFYAVDDDWELRAYYPYWGKDVPTTSDLWTKHADEWWSSANSRRQSYAVAAISGGSGANVWNDYGRLGQYWRELIANMSEGPKHLAGPQEETPPPKLASMAFAKGAWGQVMEAWPRMLEAAAKVGPLADGKTLDIPLLKKVHVPVYSDLLEKWKLTTPAATQGAPVVRVVNGQAVLTTGPAPTLPVDQWPFAQLAGLGMVLLVSVLVAATPVTLVIIAWRTAWRVRPVVLEGKKFGWQVAFLASLGILLPISLIVLLRNPFWHVWPFGTYASWAGFLELMAVLVVWDAWWRMWRWWALRKLSKTTKSSAAPAARASREPLRPAWLVGPVLAVTLLLAVEVGFIAYFWAIWQSRFYLLFFPLVMALGCTAATRLFEWPMQAALLALRGGISLIFRWTALWPKVRLTLRAITSVLGNWHALATIVFAVVILTQRAKVMAMIDGKAHPGGNTARGGYPYSDEQEYPETGAWVAKNLPNAVIMSRNPWELLFYCGPKNKGIGAVNPGDNSTGGADVILAIAHYYHVTHVMADPMREALNTYMGAHREAFKAVPGAPMQIYEIDWSKIDVKTPEQALAGKSYPG